MKYSLQSTASECGLACLATVASFHGYDIELSELRERFVISTRGSTLDDLMTIGGDLQLGSRPLRVEIDELAQLQMPCILHWNMNHFVVLLKVTAKGIEVHDPAQGVRRLSTQEVTECFTGIALEVTPTPGFTRQTDKPPIKWRDLIGKVTGWRRSILQLLLLASALQVFGLISPLFVQWVIDHAIVSGDADLLWVLIGGMVMLMLIQQFASAGRSMAAIALNNQFSLQWSSRVMGHLVRLPMSWFEKRHTGDIVSRLQSLKSIQETLNNGMAEALLDGVFSCVTAVLMLMYAPGLACVVLASVVLYALIRLASYGPLRQASADMLALSAREQSYFLETVRAAQAVKLNGLEEARRSGWMNRLVRAANRRVVTEKMNVGFRFSYGVLFGLESAIVLGWGAWTVIFSASQSHTGSAAVNAMTVGMLMAFLSYKDQFTSRAQTFIDRMIDLRMLRLQVERLADIVLARPEGLAGSLPYGAEPPAQGEPGHAGLSIELVGVSFKYGKSEHWVLRNLSMKIEAGEHVAIIGPSGCGKSTLVKLLLGLLDPVEGKILVNGLPMRQLGLGNWRRLVGSVLQDDQLFSGSLQNNIAGFSENVDRGRVENAAKQAGIHEDILAMPMGYFTQVGDMGSTLSGGQKQRLLLARAIYRHPRVLVLDEATSHLDVVREKRVNQSIAKLATTRVVIAHRPETIAMADRIINLGTIRLPVGLERAKELDNRTIHAPSRDSPALQDGLSFRMRL
jgi:ATP-binding cassette subfamily B protein RaxB